MASQLIKVTNAFTGQPWYLVQDKISCFYAASKDINKGYKLQVKTWVCFTPTEDAVPCAEPVEYFLLKFPSL